MSKPVKAMVTEDLARRYAGVDAACVVDLTGLDVKAQERLRTALREKSARVEVVKNSMARRAFSDGPLSRLGAALTGPCALVTSSESLIPVAKLLLELAKELKPLALKEAVFAADPELLSIEELSRMKTLAEIVGEFAMLVSSPGRAIAGCVASPQSKIAGCLKAMIDKAA